MALYVSSILGKMGADYLITQTNVTNYTQFHKAQCTAVRDGLTCCWIIWQKWDFGNPLQFPATYFASETSPDFCFAGTIFTYVLEHQVLELNMLFNMQHRTSITENHKKHNLSTVVGNPAKTAAHQHIIFYIPWGTLLHRLMGHCYHTGSSSPLLHTFHLALRQTAPGLSPHTLLMPLQWLNQRQRQEDVKVINESEMFIRITTLQKLSAINFSHKMYWWTESMWSKHTEVCRVVVGRTVQSQSLQIGDEVGDWTFVDTLTLTENVELWKDKIIQGRHMNDLSKERFYLSI